MIFQAQDSFFNLIFMFAQNSDIALAQRLWHDNFWLVVWINMLLLSNAKEEHEFAGIHWD